MDTQRAEGRAPPTVAVLGTAVLLLGTAGAAVVVAADPAPSPTHPVALALLALGFLAADRWPVYVEHRDESFSVSFAELVLTLGLFVVGPTALLLARVAGRAVGELSRRPTPDAKLAVNTGLLLGETAAALLVFHAVADGAGLDEPRAWAAVLLALLAAGAHGTFVLAAVLRLATGPGHGPDLRVTATTAVTCVVSGLVGLVALLLASVHPAAWLLLVVPAALGVVLHRTNARLRNEGRRARSMHEVASNLARVPELDVALVTLVGEARSSLRSEDARLLLLRDDVGRERLQLVVDGDGPTVLPAELPHGPEVAAALRQWHDGGAPDVVATPTGLLAPIGDADEVHGVLEVRGRQEGRGAFGPTDRTVLTGVAGQVAAMLSRARLRDRLRTADAARAHLETHDALTGLGNRRWFLAELGVLLSGGHVGPMALVLVNLKGFRALNEDLGHAACDRILCAVGERLGDVVGSGGLVARLGSDEFVVAAPTADADAFRDELLATTAGSVHLQGRDVKVQVAAGSAAWPADADEVGALLRRADLALDAARACSSTAGVAFSPPLEAAALRRRRLVAALREALRDGGIHLAYQPVVDLPTRRVVGVEALARWDHPVLGRVPPDEFVAVAEEEGMVGDLTALVLDMALRQARAWADEGLDAGVAVNVSAHDLAGDGLVARVERLLALHGVDPARVTLEVTETATMADPEASAAVLGRLRRLGLRLAIDDFGTGHSSLAYLRDLAATCIKIDRTFVTDLAGEARGLDVVRTVVALAAPRGLTVVAEGIEDEPTYALLRDLGVQRGQGWLMAHAMPADEVGALLRREAAAAAGTA